MKKFTLLSGIAALATVGAVFAAWTFNEGQPSDPASTSITITVDEEIVTTGVAGTFTVTPTNAATLKFSQGNNKNAKIELTNADDASYLLSYTDDASSDATYSYDVKATLTITGDLKNWIDGNGTVLGSETVTGTTAEVFTITDDDILDSLSSAANSITNASMASNFINAVKSSSISIVYTVTETPAP